MVGAYRAPTVPFRLMTANLLHERVDVAGLADLLDQHAPDVVVFQELTPVAAGVVEIRFPNHHLRPALEYTGRGIATRFDVVFGDVPMPGRDGASALLGTPDGTVYVAGVHFQNPVNFPWWVTARDRRVQLDGLLEWVRRSVPPLVIAGDFNASPIWPVYKHMASRLTDLVLDADPNPEPTWGWRPGWPRLLRIDHVFGRGLRATSVEVVPMEWSDHAAIVIDLEITGPA